MLSRFSFAIRSRRMTLRAANIQHLPDCFWLQTFPASTSMLKEKGLFCSTA